MAYDERKDGFTDSDTTGRTVVGLFPTRSAAEAAIRDLKNAGFAESQIGVAHQDRAEQRGLTESTGASAAAEGAAAGAVSGGLVGGVIGLLGSLLIPGVGPIVVGGVLASTLTGLGIGAATGGIIGALVGMGVPEPDAQHFDLGLRNGGVLVTVDAGSRTAEALTILERHGMDFGPSGTNRYGTFDRVTGAEPVEGTAAAGLVENPTMPGLDFGNMGAVDDGIGGAGGSDAGIGTPSAGVAGIGMDDVASGSSTGTRGMGTGGESQERRRWTGRERRTRQDPAYAGPERRFITT